MTLSGLRLRRPIGIGALATSGLLLCACGSAPASATKTPGTSTRITASTSKLGTTALTARAITSFPAPAGAALAAVKGRTSVPLVAPTSLPSGLSATAVSQHGDYNVQLYDCSQVLGLNNPAIGGPPDCSGEGAVFGSFGGQPFPSPASNDLTGKPITALTDVLATPCPTGTTSSTVGLGNGVKGVQETSTGEVCDLRWTQRGWIIDIEMSPTPGITLSVLKPLASELITTMSTEHLPASRGLVAVMDAGDGEHTTVYWVQGRSLYWVGDYHFASVALKLLGSVASVSG